MKQLTIFMMLFIASFSFGQSMTVTFYFPAEVAEFTTQQIDSLDKLMQAGWEPTEVMGYANALPNMTTREDNMDLARRRAETAAATVDLKPTGWAVNVGGAEYRKVEITFIKSESVTVSEPNDTILVPAIEILPGVKTSPDTIQIVKIDTVKITDTIYIVSATIDPIEVTTSSANDCCGGDKSLGQVWNDYKSFQTKAKFANTYEEKLVLTAKATAIRACWNRMHRKYKEQAKAPKRSKAKANAKTISNRIKRSRLPPRTRGLNATLFTRLFPWAAC